MLFALRLTDRVRRSLSARRLGCCCLLLGAATQAPALPQLADTLMTPIEARFERTHLDGSLPVAGFIALGGGDERVIEAARLANEHPGTMLVITGHGPRAEELVRQSGLPPERVIIEPAAKTTFENAQLTVPLLPRQHLRKWILVTSDYHMPRAVGTFRKAGVDVLTWPIPTREDSSTRLSHATHEWVGMLVYWLRGSSDALFPAAAARLPAALVASRRDGAPVAN